MIFDKVYPNIFNSFRKSYNAVIDSFLQESIFCMISESLSLRSSVFSYFLLGTITISSVLYVNSSGFLSYFGDIGAFLNVVFFSGVDISA